MTLRIEDAKRYARDRKVLYTWDLEPRQAGVETPGIELEIQHSQRAKAVTVTAWRVSHLDGMVRHVFALSPTGPRNSVLLASFPCARFSQGQLDRAEREAVSLMESVNAFAFGSVAA